MVYTCSYECHRESLCFLHVPSCGGENCLYITRSVEATLIYFHGALNISSSFKLTTFFFIQYFKTLVSHNEFDYKNVFYHQNCCQFENLQIILLKISIKWDPPPQNAFKLKHLYFFQPFLKYIFLYFHDSRKWIVTQIGTAPHECAAPSSVG